jgi:Ca-activated chloride channel family protein
MHYEELTANKVDPGLLEKSEHAEESNTFSVKVFPIPAYGSKRLELEYTQELALISGHARLVVPLKPARYRKLAAGRFRADYRVVCPSPLAKLGAGGGALKPVPSATGPAEYAGSFEAAPFEFADDFWLDLEFPSGPTRSVFLAYRDAARARKDLSPFGAGKVYSDERGYFLFDTEFNLGADRGKGEEGRSPVAVSVLFDTSLSMRWQKLDEAFEVARAALTRLEPRDRFALALFNDRVAPMAGGLRPGGNAETTKALDFVRAGSLAGGTDLAAAFREGLKPLETAPAGCQRLLLLVSDGHATDSPLALAGLQRAFEESNRTAGARLMTFGIGSDANRMLLGKLAAGSKGQFVWASETEDLTVPLAGFLDRFGRASLEQVRLSFAVPDNVEMIYPAGPQVAYDRSAVRFVGRYKGPLTDTGLTLEAEGPGGPVRREQKVELPAAEPARPWLARVWARERVDWLLERIALEGEQEDWIEELIALAREHKFVTPYTSFLAAPRALLRPRIIKPGDPLLRVKTPEDIVAVTAIFPFGLTRALRFVPDEKLWEIRFLAPVSMKDGTYRATLVLTDRAGRKYLEEKSFVIDSRPPAVRAVRPLTAGAPGQDVRLEVYADADTRRVTARVPGLPPVDLRYDARAKASVALVRLPASMLAGRYPVRLTAEDLAHNVSFAETALEVR